MQSPPRCCCHSSCQGQERLRREAEQGSRSLETMSQVSEGGAAGGAQGGPQRLQSAGCVEIESHVGPRGTKLSADKHWAVSLGQDRLASENSQPGCWEKRGLDMLTWLVALAPRARWGEGGRRSVETSTEAEVVLRMATSTWHLGKKGVT